MGLDRSLDEEGIPDLEGPLPGKVITGDPQEGATPPTDRPASFDHGVTAEEQAQPEPLDAKLRRERPDTLAGSPPDEGAPFLVAPEEEDVDTESDDDAEMVARSADPGLEGLSAEESAVHVRDAP